MSDPSYWPPASPPPPGPSRLARYLLACGLVALVSVYVFAAFFTRGIWTDTSAPRDGIRATFTAAGPDGSPPSSDALSKTKEILQKRVDDLGGPPSDVVVNGNEVSVVVPAANDDVRNFGRRVLLHVRPVIHAIRSQAAPIPSPAPPPSGAPADAAQRIADEKALRQSTEQQIQVLSMQFQATRCNQEDFLAGHDDPNLPLVTCSQDGTKVYLLDKSIISGEQIENASSAKNGDSGQYLVDMTFNHDAAELWAKFTAANVGQQTAFTVDTHVVSAPEIREAIPDGRTRISGHFTEASANDLANALDHGALPLSLTFKSSETASIPGKAPLMAPRIAVIVSGIAVALAAILGVLFLVRRRTSGQRHGFATESEVASLNWPPAPPPA